MSSAIQHQEPVRSAEAVRQEYARVMRVVKKERRTVGNERAQVAGTSSAASALLRAVRKGLSSGSGCDGNAWVCYFNAPL